LSLFGFVDLYSSDGGAGEAGGLRTSSKDFLKLLLAVALFDTNGSIARPLFSKPFTDTS
jgi:hypothetical protein